MSFLNIWTPHIECDAGGNNYPVMVWIYGGGSASLDVYDGKVLSAVEQVSVASMQYRVGFVRIFVLAKFNPRQYGTLRSAVGIEKDKKLYLFVQWR